MAGAKKDELSSVFGEDFVDLFIKLKKRPLSEKYQFRRLFSELYKCEEYVWQGILKKDDEIEFVHADLRKLPNPYIYNQISGPGITLSGGEACMSLECRYALNCPVSGSDLIYNFFDETSKLYYIGETKKVTIYIRIYDNISGLTNDRWLVISME